MQKNDNKLPLIREVVLKYLPNSRVILFGSRASDKYDARSDYDVMAVTPYNLSIDDIKAIKPKIRRDLALFHIPIDIIIATESEVVKTSVLTNHIFNEALSTGIAI
ncbi:MAG TPA: nucleotidyltransferase domain-containing protein [Bacteroidales bacterium]|nr:nucleotidyltransferase domain-containing protein [Paludibacteraceae bacterium]HPI31214.1 nucleotidyltransferase domain-containing protein [Bacteroidales bacterium]HQN17386.1 nucleotidyltransferase domain-containing protein [Bacteroidales bacterium]